MIPPIMLKDQDMMMMIKVWCYDADDICMMAVDDDVYKSKNNINNYYWKRYNGSSFSQNQSKPIEISLPPNHLFSN